MWELRWDMSCGDGFDWVVSMGWVWGSIIICIDLIGTYYSTVFYDYVIVWSGIGIICSDSFMGMVVYFSVLVVLGMEWWFYDVMEMNVMMDSIYIGGLVVLFMVSGCILVC